MDLLPDIASRSGLQRIRAALVAGAVVDAQDKKGRTALFQTARLGKIDHVKLLLEYGANPNACDTIGEAPLQVAARYGHYECVEILVKAGSQIDYFPNPNICEYSETALCSAVRKGHISICELLLNAGASPNASSSALRFPLIEAAGRGYTAMCRRLVEAGANINQQDPFGSTALHHAIRSQSIETVRILLDMFANVNAKDRGGTTPVLEAISPILEQSVPLLYALLKYKPDLSIRGSRLGYTPLEQAVAFELGEIADLLRTAGAKDTQPSLQATGYEPEEMSDETEDDDPVAVSGNCWEASIEEKDKFLAEELCKRKVPALLKNYGWEASPPHWCILERSTDPIPLSRVAYFARGFCNRPTGKELEDGPEILGESYQSAVNRFVSLGLLRVLDPIDLVRLLVTTADLKPVAKKWGIKLPSKRADMIEAILAKATAEEFPEVVKRGPYFITTPKGNEAIRSRVNYNIQIESRLKTEIIEALLEPNLKWALLLSQEFASLHRRPRHIRPETVCKARLVLEKEIPKSISYEPAQAPLLRAIAVACGIVRGADEWSQWRPVRTPINDSAELIMPSTFASLIMFSDGAETWEDSHDDD